MIESNLFTAIYTSGHILTYYFSIIFCIIEKIRVFANLWFLQFNGIEFFDIFYHYKVERRKNFYLLFTLWILHILTPISFGVYQLFLPHELVSHSLQSIMFIENLCTFFVSWSVPFLMWNISVHAFENLVKMKNTLIKNIEENSGIDHLFFNFLVFLFTF